MPARSSIPSGCGAKGETSRGEDRSTHEGPNEAISCVVNHRIVTGPWDPDKPAQGAADPGYSKVPFRITIATLK
jgi:hypothetical protein